MGEETTPKVENKQSSPSKPDYVDQYAPWIVRGAILGLGITGVAVFARSIRLFSRFEHVRDIPREFIDRQFNLRGTIRGVTNAGGLRVLHAPIIPVPRLLSSAKAKQPSLLTVRLAAVDVSDPGVCWLRDNICDTPKSVRFRLIKETHKESDSVDCEVTLKRRWLPMNYSLNQELIRRGLAKIPGVDVQEHLWALRNVPAYSRLVNQLLLSEKVADRMGVGMWRRQTWVEYVKSLPSQTRDLVLGSTVVKFGELVGESGKNVATGVYRLCLISWHVGKRTIGVVYVVVSPVFSLIGRLFRR